MKKLLAMVALMTAVVFACTGCSSSLFSDESTVKFGDTYTQTRKTLLMMNESC